MLSSKVFYKSKDVVLEEKLMFNFIYYSFGNPFKYDYIITDLAVPLSPINIAGIFLYTI